jgi:hypothetical protein
MFFTLFWALLRKNIVFFSFLKFLQVDKKPFKKSIRFWRPFFQKVEKNTLFFGHFGPFFCFPYFWPAFWDPFGRFFHFFFVRDHRGGLYETLRRQKIVKTRNSPFRLFPMIQNTVFRPENFLNGFWDDLTITTIQLFEF